MVLYPVVALCCQKQTRLASPGLLFRNPPFPRSHLYLWTRVLDFRACLDGIEISVRADRYVFGIATIPFALAVVRQFAPLTGPSLLSLRAVDALSWTIAAAMCATVLASGMGLEAWGGA